MEEREKQAAEIPQVVDDATTREPPPEVQARGHEGIEANTRGIMIAAAGLLALMTLGVLIAVWLMAGWFGRAGAPTEEPESPTAAEEQPLEAPVQPNQAVETQRQRQAMQQVLQSYGWIQRDPAIVRIPIDRAMEVIAEQGFQPWGSEQPTGTRQGESDASP